MIRNMYKENSNILKAQEEDGANNLSENYLKFIIFLYIVFLYDQNLGYVEARNNQGKNKLPLSE